MGDSDQILHIKPFKGRGFAADLSDPAPAKPFSSQGQPMMFSSNGTKPNKVTKPKVLPESPQMGPIEEAPSPGGRRMPFGGLARNDRFLDKDNSAEGIEIFVKGAPPAKIQSLNSASQDNGYASAPSDQNSGYHDFKRRDTGPSSFGDLDPSPKLRNFSSVQQESIPSASPRLKQASYSTLPTAVDREPTRTIIDSPLPLKQATSTNKLAYEAAGSIPRYSDHSSSEKGSPNKLLKFVPSKETLPTGSSPRPSHSNGSPPELSAFELPVTVAQVSYPPADSIDDREATFNDIIENVSKIDTKKCLREQISSSYALLQVVSGLTQHKRTEIEKLVGEKEFSRVYTRIKTQVSNRNPDQNRRQS